MGDINANELNWHEKPLRIAAVQCNYGENSLDILENHVVKGRFNTEQLLHLNAQGHTSFYNHERDAEKLINYLAEAKKRNIRVILYWNTHCVEQPERDAHPGWIQRDKNKDEVKAYSNKFLICINSPWADDFFDNLKKVCSLNIDGIFLDGPVVNAQGCHCSACQALFQGEKGKSIFDASYREMLQFKVESVTNYVRKTCAIKNSIRPGILVYLNNSALRPDVTGSDTTRVEPHVEMLGAEAGFACINRGYDLCHMTPHIKYIETKARGKPYVVFMAGDNKPHSYYMHTAAETRMLYNRSIAHGANIWYGIHAPTPIMKSPGGQAAYECNRFHEKYSEYYLKTSSENKIAVVWSGATANYYSSSVEESDFTRRQDIGVALERANHTASFHGFCRVLQSHHAQFDVIDEQTILDNGLSKYDLAILPVCACISAAVFDKIEAYVRGGGNILATYDTGCYDESGGRLGHNRVAELFGIRRMNGTLNYEPGTSYMAVDRAYARGLNAEILPGPVKVIDCAMSDTVETIARINRPMASRYVAFPEMALPLLTINAYGGGKCVYCAGNLGEFIQHTTYSDNMLLVYNIVERFANPLVRSNAPRSVEIVVRRQEMFDRYTLHLVNMTGEMALPTERLIPIRGIEIKLDLRKNAKKARVLGDTAKIRFNAASQTVRIAEMNDYCAIVLE